LHLLTLLRTAGAAVPSATTTDGAWPASTLFPLDDSAVHRERRHEQHDNEHMEQQR
jgi:hypothetical protein